MPPPIPSSPSPANWEPPSLEELHRMLPQYEITEMIGLGGMGAVYKGRQANLERDVAIKILCETVVRGDDELNFAARFKQEAKAMAQLDHPAIVSVIDFGETSDGQLYLVMEFIDGMDIHQYLQYHGGKLTQEDALTITAHVLDALGYAHSKGIAHRDIKPANILLNQEGRVKIADFGLAKKFGDAADDSLPALTTLNTAIGTPDFVAPEALETGKTVDHRADLYAVGVMLYQMLTGKLPKGMVKLPSELDPNLDERLDAILEKAMEPDPEHRYASAAEIRTDIDRIVSQPITKVEAGGKVEATPAVEKVPVVAGTNGSGGAGSGKMIKPAEREKPKTALYVGIGLAAMVVIGGLVLVIKPDKKKGGSEAVMPSEGSPKSIETPKAAAGELGNESSKTKIVESNPVGNPPVDQAKQDGKGLLLPSVSPGIAKQTLDLLALTDPVQDRADMSPFKNEWTRSGAELVFKNDGGSGKLVAPVAFYCSDYEIELRAERLSGGERIHTAVPLGDGRILPLVFNYQGSKVINGKEGKAWTSSDPLVHVSIRVQSSRDGLSDRVTVQRKDSGETLADWTGSMDKLGMAGKAHPAFPGQAVASIFLTKDPYAIKTWTLRVFEGEAKLLRNMEANTVTAVEKKSAMPPTSIVPATAPGTTDGWRNLFDGRTFSGWTAKAGSDPSKSWRISDGEISSEDRTILLSPDSYTDYELELEWKMGTRGNGGVFYHAQGTDHLAALEMQLCDPANSGGVRSGGLYGIKNETRDVSKPLGEWNTARLVVRGSAREHWINGEKVCVYDVSSDQFRHLMDGSKLKVKVDSSANSGRIALQANAGSVSYRNVRLRSLNETAPALTTVPAPSAAPAMQPSTAPTSTPVVPSLSSSDPRLAQLETGFKARYEAEAQKPYLTALATLNQNYVANGIGRARTSAQQKGSLEEVTILDSEKTRIQNGDPLPPADLDTLPKSLKNLRRTYRSALERIEIDRSQKASPLYDLYLGALDVYIAELTKENKITEARQVKTLRDEIAAQKPKTDAAVATSPMDSPTRTGMNQPGAKPAPTDDEDSTFGRGSRWQEAAHWVVSVGGFLRVEKRDQFINVTKEEDIPSGKFEVLEIYIRANPKSAGIQDDDFTRFSGLKLRSLRLTGLKVTDAAFAFLPSTPDIETFVLDVVPVTDAVLDHLAPLQKLTELQIQSAPQFTGAGLEKLASLPILKTAWFSRTVFSDAEVKTMAAAKSLEYIRLDGTPVTDEGIAGLGVLTKLQTISLNSCKNVRGATLAAWGNMASLRTFELGECPLDAEAFPAIGRLTQLTKLDLSRVATLDDEALSALAPLTKLTQLKLTETRITGTGFAALRACTELQFLGLNYGTPITTEGLAAIASAIPKLEKLELGSGAKLNSRDFRTLAELKALKKLGAPLPALDDAALAEIANIASLDDLYISDSVITAKGIAALKSMKFLTKLNMSNCKNIDDTAIPALKELKWLKELTIRRTAITEEGAATLMKSLPGCRVLLK